MHFAIVASDSAKRVATSLCQILFGVKSASAASHLETILSADLKSLKRRGFIGWSCSTYFHCDWLIDTGYNKVDQIVETHKPEYKPGDRARLAKAPPVIREPASFSLSRAAEDISSNPRKVVNVSNDKSSETVENLTPRPLLSCV